MFAELGDDERRFFVKWLESDERITTKAQGQRLLCILQAIVSRNGVTRFPDVPADCLCTVGAFPGFENAGESVRFIINATLKAIADAKVAT